MSHLCVRRTKSLWQTQTPAVGEKNITPPYPYYTVIMWIVLCFYEKLQKLVEHNKEIQTFARSRVHNSVLVCIHCAEVTQDLLSWHMSLIFILLSWVCVIQSTKTETAKCSATVEAFRYYLLSMNFVKAPAARSLVLLINNEPLWCVEGNGGERLWLRMWSA